MNQNLWEVGQNFPNAQYYYKEVNMSEFRLTTIEEMEAATARLLETAEKVGADTWQLRV
jgi:hypothetical protein